MIKGIKDDRINWFVKFILPTHTILELDPIIAGSSMLSAYRAIKLHDTPQKWKELQRFLERGNPHQAKVDSFGDIDIWFDKDNPIHDSRHELHWLIADTDPAMPAIEMQTMLTNIGGKFKEASEAYNNLGFFRLSKTSRWANTYYCNTTKAMKPLTKEIQIIKKSFSSIEELLETFDFINCSVAWRDGTLYYDDRIDDAFESFELRLNNAIAYESSSVAKRIFSALRAFKYSGRYSLDFCPILTENIFKLYFDSKDIDYDSYQNHIIEIEEHYGRTISPVETLKGMVKSFQNLFEKFSNMKHFKKEQALYLIDHVEKFPGLKKLIEANDLERQTPKRPGTGLFACQIFTI